MYGARIERGQVVGASDAQYAVKSVTREGIYTPPIPAIDNTAYTVGDMVYFFLFEDGTGAILARIG